MVNNETEEPESPEEEVSEGVGEEAVSETDIVGEKVEGLTENVIEPADQRWCPICKKWVIGIGKRKNICPICKSFTKKSPTSSPQKYVPKTKRGRKPKSNEEEPERAYEMESVRAVRLGGRDMALAEILINAGLAKDFSDLTRKGLYVMSAMFNLGNLNNPNPTLKMEKQEYEPDPKRLSKELLEQQMLKAYIKNLEKGDQTDPLNTLILLRLLENRNESKNNPNFMDRIIEAQIIKSLTQNNQDSHLMKEIADLKYQLQQQQLLSQLKDKGGNLQEQLMALEKIRAERDQKIREAELKAQQERDKTLRIAIDTKLKELEKAIQEVQASGGSFSAQRLKEFREELKAVKEMAAEIGQREKGAGEYISETIGQVADKIGPVISDYIKNKEAQKQQAMQEIIQQPPIETQQPETQPTPSTPEQTQPEPPKQENPFGLTGSEQELSNQMADMYLKKRE